MNHEFNLYWVDMKYIRNLHNIDDRVYIVSPQSGKQSRPCLGIIINIKGYKYCIPLSKVKDKYDNMSDKIDFTKIIIDNKIVAGINFSRMIPVEMQQLKKIDIKLRKHDRKEVIKWKKILKQELDWCNQHRDIIINKANVLYNKYVSDEYFKRRKDCLNFPKLEAGCDKYNKK